MKGSDDGIRWNTDEVVCGSDAVTRPATMYSVAVEAMKVLYALKDQLQGVCGALNIGCDPDREDQLPGCPPFPEAIYLIELATRECNALFCQIREKLGV